MIDDHHHSGYTQFTAKRAEGAARATLVSESALSEYGRGPELSSYNDFFMNFLDTVKEV